VDLDPQRDVPLAPLSTLEVGGPARWYVRAASVEDVQRAHAWAAARDLPVFVLGGGSNIVVADRGYDGLVLHASLRGIRIGERGDEAMVDAGAGEPWDPLVARVVDRGYGGLECLSGIPGAVGGTPIQNVGAYGQEVASAIESVTVVDRRSSETVALRASECAFAYRQSRFKDADAGRFTVCRVVFRVRRQDPLLDYPDVMAWAAQRGLTSPTLRDVRDAVLAIRRAKGMVLDQGDPDTRSVGSFFTNPLMPAAAQRELGAPGFAMPDGRVKVPAAWLIERAGFTKGFAAGGAGLSSKHPLAIINRGGARAEEIVALAFRIKQTVLERFGVSLRTEPIFVGFDRDERVLFLQKAGV
jgi:UDP-N-acetylmuramate dehydrogenase